MQDTPGNTAQEATEPATPKPAPKARAPKRRLRFWLFRLPLVIISLLALVLLGAETVTYTLSAGHCHEKAEECPEGSVGLVLGCSKLLGKGRPNYYFEGRMQAAAELWHSGRVTHIIVSGDNSSRYYNEPKDMKDALVALGVPEDCIVCDYAGFRTYDSVIRARDTYHADKLIIVSQPSHVARAVAIARFLGMEAEGLNAPLRPISFSSRCKQQLRERCARVAMVLDFIIGRNPASFEDKEPITSVPEP